MRIDAFAVAVPGLEQLLLAEVQRLGIRPARAVRGGVECTLTWPQLWSLNLWSRVATRVLVRVARFRADGTRSLESALTSIDWSAWLAPETGVQVTATVDGESGLHHTGAVEERVAASLGQGSGGRHFGEQSVLVRVMRDTVTISLDSSGAPLHQRGWRGPAGKAPLRESLAAAVVLASGWDRRSPFVDPFCGAGTLPIEAALIARRIAPGRHRSFAFQHWPSYSDSKWERLLAAADADVLDRCPPLFASDRDAGAVAATVENAARAQVAVTVEQRAISDLVLPPQQGWLVANPPYGHRVGGRDLRDLYDRLGAVLRERAGGWRVALLATHETPVQRVGVPWESALETANGGLAVTLHVATV